MGIMEFADREARFGAQKMTSTHGLAQSTVLSIAAIKLSEARNYLKYISRHNWNTVGLRLSAEQGVRDAQEDYDTAYDAYTHRGKVQKTVDARWPKFSDDPLYTAQLLAQGTPGY